MNSRCRPSRSEARPPSSRKPAEEQGVDVHDPLQPERREVEVRLDRWQRDVHDRRVEHDHELRDADENEDEPTVDGRCQERLPSKRTDEFA
jgi:hypothetical protein